MDDEKRYLRDLAKRGKYTPEKAKELGYVEMLEAMTFPDVPELAIKIYNFLASESYRAIRYIPAMSPIPHYIDKSYLREEMKQQLNMDLNRYNFIIPIMETKIFEQFENNKSE